MLIGVQSVVFAFAGKADGEEVIVTENVQQYVNAGRHVKSKTPSPSRRRVSGVESGRFCGVVGERGVNQSMWVKMYEWKQLSFLRATIRPESSQFEL